MSVSESAYRDLGRRLMSHPSLPEGLRSLKTKVDEAVAAYDTSGLEQALFSLGKAAHSQEAPELIPEDLRPLFGEQRPESESTLPSNEENSTDRPLAVRPLGRKRGPRPMFNLIDSCLALAIVAMFVYGYFKFLRKPSVPPQTPEVHTSRTAPPQIQTPTMRPPFRPMPMIRQGNAPNIPSPPPQRTSGWMVATKPRRPGTSPDQAALSRARRDLLRAEAALRGDQSEVGQAMAVLNRISVVLASQVRGTELAALAESYRHNEATYTFRGQEHNAGKNLAGVGLEWILSLIEQAGIPLQLVHKLLVDWPEPACIVELAEVPLAMRLLDTKHLDRQDEDASQHQRDDSAQVPGERPYTEDRRLDVSKARQALVFPRYAVRRDHELVFENLRQIDGEAAALLATHRHGLRFPALEELSEDVAASLAQHVGGWSRTGATYDDTLAFDGLKRLSPAVAAALATRASGTLELGSSAAPLDEISEATAKSLSQYRGRALILHVRRMSRDSQDHLADFTGMLQLNSGDGEQSIEAEGTNKGLADLSSPALVEAICRVGLNPVMLECRAITSEALSSLIEHAHGRDILFTCLESLPDKTAEQFLELAGEVTFLRLRQASPKALRTLTLKPTTNWQ